MKIFVCVKQVPDTTGKVAVNEDGTLNRASMSTIINPDDLNAVEAALQLKDETGCEVIALSMGPMTAETMLREVLAMGADRAVLVSGREFGGSDTFATSQILAAAIDTIGLETDDMIFCGQQAIDGDTAQVGPQIAEKLHIPQAAYAAELHKEEGGLNVKQLLEDGYKTLHVEFPCLVTCIKELNIPRYMTIRGVYGAFEKKITILNYEDLKDHPLIEADTIGLKGSPTNIYRSFTPPQKKGGQLHRTVSRDVCQGIVVSLADRHLI